MRVAASHLAGGPAVRVIEARSIDVALDRSAVYYYRHGWQSWSLSCWHALERPVPLQLPSIYHPLQCDPAFVRMREPNGSWVGAVRFADRSVLLLGALATDAHVALRSVDGGSVLRGWIDATIKAPDGSFRWLVALGSEDEVFAAYGCALAEAFGADARLSPAGREAQRVWCSWYSLYTGVSARSIDRVIRDLGDFPIDTIQIDDGWQVSVGDWEANGKFAAGMAEAAARIRASGRRAGLWLAPFVAVPSSRLAREHRDWLLRDDRGRLVSAGFNWGEPLYALDVANAAVLAWLSDLMRRVRSWGYDYLKLDFLYAGALPRAEGPREALYRNALAVMREAMGDAYFVACGAPIVPSLGLCDALRIGPDVAGHWTSTRDERILTNPSTPGTRNAIRTSIHRLWLAPAVALDPDVVYLTTIGNTLTEGERHELRMLARLCGFVATSDPPASFVGDRTAMALFTESPVGAREGAYRYGIAGDTVDFTASAEPPRPSGGWTLARVVVGLIGNVRVVLRLIDAQSRATARRRERDFLK